MKADVHSSVRKTLAKKHAGYVLITCDKPSADGFMQIKMSYDGDAVLASYLLQGAQEYLDEDCQESCVTQLQANDGQSVVLN